MIRARFMADDSAPPVPEGGDPQPRPFVEILASARGGSQDAINELCKRYYEPIRKVVHRDLARDVRGGRPWLLARFSTGDVVQEVFLGLLSELGAFEGESEEAFIGYLSIMVRNRIIDAVRFHEAARRDGRTSRSAEAAYGERAAVPDPGQAAALREMVETFEAELQKFPARERALLRGRLDQELTFQELGTRLEYPTGAAARKAFYRVLARLTIRLESRLGEE